MIPEPTILLPRLVLHAPSALSIVGEGRERRLRFRIELENVGAGPLELCVSGTGRLDSRAVQRVLARYPGSERCETERERTVARLVPDERHGHRHLDSVLRFALLDETFTPSLDARGGECPACLRDQRRTGAGGPLAARYSGQGDLAGISVGWSAVSEPDQPGQEVALGALPDGVYLLVVAVPTGFESASSPDDLVAGVKLRLVGERVERLEALDGKTLRNASRRARAGAALSPRARPGAWLAALGALGLGACASWPCPAGSSQRALPVVVVGVASGGSYCGERAFSRAAGELGARLRLELERRENARRAGARPGERVRDWAAADRALASRARELLDADAGEVQSTLGGDALVASRINGNAFDVAVEEARAAGRAAPVRIAVIPLAVEGVDEASARRLYGLRDVYSAGVREALEAEGRVQVVAAPEVYAALEAVGARADRPLERAQVTAACARLRVDALAHGSVAPGQGGLAVTVELRDGGDGRLLGTLDGEARTPSEVVSLSRRHALLWRAALGVER